MTTDSLKLAIDALPIAERVRLLSQYGSSHSADLSGAEVTVVDIGPKGVSTPHAVVRYDDGSEECIDIIESVKRNATSVGHPAILLAIYWWENIVRRELALTVNHIQGDRLYVELARRNLKLLGTALLQGAQARRLSKEDSFALFVRTWDLDHPRSNLKLAWELLGGTDLKECAEGERLKYLVKRLRERTHVDGRRGDDYDNSAGTITAGQVIKFLRTEAGGKYLKNRGKWLAFRNAFFAETFGLTQETVRAYLPGTRTVKPEAQPNDRFMYPSLPLANTFRLDELILPPTVPYVPQGKRD
jgi:hypothetical protein